MDKRRSQRIIMDRETLSATPRCPACGKYFSLGERVVPACGDWGNTPRLVHEEDAVFEEASGRYVARRCVDFNKNQS
ncbi:MAG: hypothetical protein KFF46_10710 [Desulfobacterales bacterium]|nr:hypothetical protein [Desulfobacterales bacterium]